MRKSWHAYFMDIAIAASTRSTCPRLHVGAVVVKDRRIISTGFNGSIPGDFHCDEEGCLMYEDHCIRTIHAEMNALLQAGGEARGADLYCTHRPCLLCAKLIAAAGIATVFYSAPYKADLARSAFMLALHPEAPWPEAFHIKEVTSSPLSTSARELPSPSEPG